MKAMVLAAGRGERMRPLTDRVPKPLLPVGGEPLVGHLLRRLAAAGIGEVVMNVSWRAEQVRERLGTGAEWGVTIAYSAEPWPPLETGGGIFAALPLLGPGPFLLANGDVWSDIAPASLRLDPACLAHLALVPNPPHNLRGDFGLHEGLVDPDALQRLTYAGMAILDPELFAGCAPGRFALAPLLIAAARLGKVSGSLHEGEWLDVGTPERLYALQARLGVG